MNKIPSNFRPEGYRRRDELHAREVADIRASNRILMAVVLEIVLSGGGYYGLGSLVKQHEEKLADVHRSDLEVEGGLARYREAVGEAVLLVALADQQAIGQMQLLERKNMLGSVWSS